MRILVPSVITDPEETTPAHWRAIYPGMEAKLAAKIAKRIWIRTRAAEAQSWRCCWCGRRMCEDSDRRDSVTAEHAIPRSLGGGDDPDNIAAACARCNTRRGTASPEEFMRRVIANRWNENRNPGLENGRPPVAAMLCLAMEQGARDE